MPDAFKAVISQSLESLLYAIRTAIRNEMGMIYMRNEGKTNIINFMTVKIPTPWLTINSISLRTLLKRDVIVKMTIVRIKGTAISLKR